MAVKPTQITDWATSGSALKLDPNSVQQTKGWDTDDGTTAGVPEKPTLQHQNGWQNIVHQWIKYFEELTDKAIVPLGGIIAVSGNNPGSLDIPPGQVIDGYMLCNGTAIPGGNAVSGTLPQLSDNRFIMGSTLSAGVTSGSNTKDFSHSHTVDSHAHSMQSHTHAIGTHTHTSVAHSHQGDGGGFKEGLYAAQYYNDSLADAPWQGRIDIERHLIENGPLTVPQWHSAPTVSGPTEPVEGKDIYYGIKVRGETGATSVTTQTNADYNSGVPSSTNTGTDAPGTDTQLSASEDILPQYYTSKYYMRVN